MGTNQNNKIKKRKQTGVTGDREEPWQAAASKQQHNRKKKKKSTFGSEKKKAS